MNRVVIVFGSDVGGLRVALNRVVNYFGSDVSGLRVALDIYECGCSRT